MSKYKPAIQNISLRTDLGRQLREAFVLDACRKNGIKEINYAELERRLASSDDPHADVQEAMAPPQSGGEHE